MKNKFKIQNSKFKIDRGFTLIELLVVIVIIGILAAFTTVNLIGVRQRARDGRRKADLKAIQSAMELFRADIGCYPYGIAGCYWPPEGFPTCGAQFHDSTGSIYLQKTPCDPLTNTSYFYASGPQAYQLWACLENGSDPDKDNPKNGACATASYTVRNP